MASVVKAGQSFDRHVLRGIGQHAIWCMTAGVIGGADLGRAVGGYILPATAGAALFFGTPPEVITYLERIAGMATPETQVCVTMLGAALAHVAGQQQIRSPRHYQIVAKTEQDWQGRRITGIKDIRRLSNREFITIFGKRPFLNYRDDKEVPEVLQQDYYTSRQVIGLHAGREGDLRVVASKVDRETGEASIPLANAFGTPASYVEFATVASCGAVFGAAGFVAGTAIGVGSKLTEGGEYLYNKADRAIHKAQKERRLKQLQRDRQLKK